MAGIPFIILVRLWKFFNFIFAWSCDKKESDLFQDRFRCFHNGIILIVICFILVWQAILNKKWFARCLYILWWLKFSNCLLKCWFCNQKDSKIMILLTRTFDIFDLLAKNVYIYAKSGLRNCINIRYLGWNIAYLCKVS